MVEIQGVHINGTFGPQPCKCIVLILVYRPPRGNSLDASTRIQNYIRGIPNYDKKEIILLGDFNWDVSIDNGFGFEFVGDMLNEFGLTQLIKCHTRIGLNRASTLDLILTIVNNVLKSGCLDRTPSDHYPTFMIKRREQLVIERIEVRNRKMSDYDLDIFAHKLINIDWSILDLLEDVNEMWDMIYKGLIFELDLMSPLTFVKVRKNRPLWFGKALAFLAKERDLLFAKYSRGGRKNKDLYAQAVSKRREFNTLVKNAKKDFFKDQFVRHQKDQKKFWENMHTLMGKKNQVPIERVYRHGTDILLELKDSADEINCFFATVGDRTAATIGNSAFRQLDDPSSVKLLKFTPFTWRH